MVVEKCNNRERVTQKLLSLFCEKVEELLGVRPHKEKINISKEFINKAKER